MSLPFAQQPPMKRPRFQFSIRTLFLLTLCVACFSFGWVACRWRMERGLRQAELEARKALDVAKMERMRAEELAYEAKLHATIAKVRAVQARRAKKAMAATRTGDEEPVPDE